MFERKELIRLRNKAKNMAKAEGLNPSWQRAYLRLADAANNIDAMIARTMEIASEGDNGPHSELPSAVKDG